MNIGLVPEMVLLSRRWNTARFGDEFSGKLSRRSCPQNARKHIPACWLVGGGENRLSHALPLASGRRPTRVWLRLAFVPPAEAPIYGMEGAAPIHREYGLWQPAMPDVTKADRGS